ncbi:MAG: hypothetical protein KAJ14_12595 [Candidatus Omnitrophica bacterium]|nr:hypothetical protein [Candidatus Omnitrophota bacterium]
MSKKNNQIFGYFIIVISVLAALIVFRPDFTGPDEPIYLSYIISIFEDGDLNIANQLYSSGDIFSISKTYNYMDYHNHGGILLWAPFYVYAKAIYFIADRFDLIGLSEYNEEIFVRAGLSLSTIIFAFFILYFTYIICKEWFSNKIAIWSIIVMFFGTPFFYYTLFEPGNANIIASLFSVLLILFFMYVIDKGKLDWLLYGLFLSICTVLKVDLWFQVFFIFLGLITFLYRKKTKLINGLYFLLGFLIVFILKIINDYIKYGAIHTGELGLINFNGCFFLDQLFSSFHGFFYTSPIFYCCLLGIVLVITDFLKNIKDKNINNNTKNQILLIFSLMLIVKIVFLGYRFSWGDGTCGARPLITEFLICVLLYAKILQKNTKPLIKYLVIIISSFAVLWNILITSEYIGLDTFEYITKAPGIFERVYNFKYIISRLYSKCLYLKFVFFMPLLLGGWIIVVQLVKRSKCLPGFFLLSKQSNRVWKKFFYIFTIYLFLTYFMVTILNIINNGRNVKKIELEGFYDKAMIITPNIFKESHNYAELAVIRDYFEKKGDIKKVNNIQILQKKYLEKMRKLGLDEHLP